jgi:hypothetical protein
MRSFYTTSVLTARGKSAHAVAGEAPDVPQRHEAEPP